jgi:hypothetical protein
MVQKNVVFDAKWLLDRAMVSGRYATNLISEFDTLVENRSANIFQIAEEIAALEGSRAARASSITKPAELLKGKWLKGLWHKHYNQAQFMPRNLQNHWRKPGRFEELWHKAMKDRQVVDEQAIALLAHGMVHDGYVARAARKEMTGEWIVFARYNEINYYLTLGHHGDDESIWRRCQACSDHFPELAILKETR